MKKFDVACIIDDDPIFIFATKRMMQLANFCDSFLVFHNGKDAFSHISQLIHSNQKVPDVIFLDLNMPVMDGWEFLDELIKIPSSQLLTIYIVSSSINPDDIKKANKYDTVRNYIIKPISAAQLLSLLETETR